MVNSFHIRIIIKTILCAFLFCCTPKEQKKNEKKEMFLPKDLNIINVKNSVPFDTNWYNYENKVVVFIKKAGPYSTLNLDWQSAISKFPDIAFLFYISEPDSSKLINHLKEVDFQHPVIHDYNFEFRNKNIRDKELTFISFLVKNNMIIEKGNPSIPNFHDRLFELMNNHK